MWSAASSALLLPILSASARPAPNQNAAVKAQLQRLYAAQDIAIARKDSAGFYANCAPNFVYVDARGMPSDLAQDKANFATICANSESIATRGAVQSVALLPDGSASAVVRLHVDAVSANPRAELVTNETVRDVWVRAAGGRWREITSRVLATKTVAKPVPLDSFRARFPKR